MSVKLPISSCPLVMSMYLTKNKGDRAGVLILKQRYNMEYVLRVAPYNPEVSSVTRVTTNENELDGGNNHILLPL